MQRLQTKKKTNIRNTYFSICLRRWYQYFCQFITAKRYVSAAIESILNQSFTNFELIIINDASSDHSLRMIERHDDPRIQIIDFAKRKGLVQSLNYALDEARGEYIARQDADDFSLPPRFQTQLRYFHDHPQTALLGTSVRCIDEHGKAVEERIALPTPPRYFNSSPFVHGSVMVKKSVIAEVGGTMNYSRS